MRGTILPLPNTPSWRGAQLKMQGQFYLLPHKGIFVIFTRHEEEEEEEEEAGVLTGVLLPVY
jgi:hypothetical protein